MTINPSEHRPQRPAVDPERDRRLAWITKVRGMHRYKRLAGFVGCILGAALLLWWKFSADAPEWAMPVGFAVIGLSWVVFIYVIVTRWRWVKQNPYRPGGPAPE